MSVSITCTTYRQASRSETYTYSVPAYFQQFQCCSGYRARSGGGCERKHFVPCSMHMHIVLMHLKKCKIRYGIMDVKIFYICKG